MTQQEHSIIHDVYTQITLSDYVELLSGWWEFIAAFNLAKEDKARMRKFRKMIAIHDKHRKAETINLNSI